MIAALLLTLQDPHAHHRAPVGDAPIQITISPEARVAVTRGGPLPRWRCGTPLTLDVSVENQSATRASLVATAGQEVVILQQPGTLSGATNDRRMLILKPSRSPADITLAFDIGPGTQDIGWRGETHFVITCEEGSK